MVRNDLGGLIERTVDLCRKFKFSLKNRDLKAAEAFFSEVLRGFSLLKEAPGHTLCYGRYKNGLKKLNEEVCEIIALLARLEEDVAVRLDELERLCGVLSKYRKEPVSSGRFVDSRV